ncbi:hypothetical protein KA082_00090 [Candidatus Woesebacteria bacterium]|nr:hypothetical protein [Candidatus Woesebacteria bacterium]
MKQCTLSSTLFKSSFAFVVGVVLTVALIAPGIVLAQDAPQAASDPAASASPTLPPGKVDVNTVFLKPQDTERPTQLLTLYQNQVEKYRTLEREYTIAKAQFKQLNTLQSLEQTVVATRDVMVARDEVLITYCELLHAYLEESQGVDVSAKSANLKALEAQIVSLREHTAATAETKDRAGIADRVSDFSTRTETLEEKAYTALSLIATGRVQSVFDKAVILYEDIKKHHAENTVSALKQEERMRAYIEVEGTIKKLEADMLSIQTTLRESGASKNIYKGRLNKNLNSAYVNNSQLLDFLDELFFKLT